MSKKRCDFLKRFCSSVFFFIFQRLFIVCSGFVSVCEPVLLTKMSKNVFFKKRKDCNI